MKVASASSTAFFDSAEVSLAGFPRITRAARASRLSRRALLHVEDRAARGIEVTLRVLLSSSLLLALGDCFWQLAQN